MVPTLNTTLGVKGHRPVVGTRDCKDLLYVLAVINVVTGTLHANTLESPAKAKQMTGQSKTRRMHEAFASNLRHIGRLYPAEKHKVTLTMLPSVVSDLQARSPAGVSGTLTAILSAILRSTSASRIIPS